MSAKGKIILMLTSFTNGGVETQVSLIANGLKKIGWEVLVISLLSPDPPEKIEVLSQQGIKYLTLDMKRGRVSPKDFFTFISMLRREMPDVLCTFMYHSNLLGRFSRLFVKVPVLVSSIRTEYFRNKRRELIFKLSNSLSDAIVVNSENVRKSLVSRKIIGLEKSLSIVNGVDIDYFNQNTLSREDAKRLFNVDSKEFLWSAIGRIEAPKDYRLMLRAFALVVENKKRTRLMIAGRGSLLDEMNVLSSELGIEGAVTFLGDQKDCRNLLKASDALVMSSAWEGMPNAVMEAMASGVPVVSANVGGVSELVEDGVTGFLVNSRSSVVLAEAMLRLMNLSEVRRAEMSMCSREKILTEFNFTKLAENYNQLFSRLNTQ